MVTARSRSALLAVLVLSVSASSQVAEEGLHASYAPLRTFRVSSGYEIELAIDLTNYGAEALHIAATFLGTKDLESRWHVSMGDARLAPGKTQRLVQLVRIPEAELRRWQD